MSTDCLIRGLGFHVPANIVTNADLEKMVETSDEWITTRTGIKERRISTGEACSDLAEGAARKALADAGMEAEELTHILVATFTPDHPLPSSSCLLEHKLGLKGRFAADISAACTGFLYALETARGILCLNPQAKVLVAASEVLSTRTNWTDRNTCVLFGDGSGAAVITRAEEGLTGGRVLDTQMSSDGSLGDLLTVRGGGSGAPLRLGDTVGEDFFIQMQGQEVFKHAVRSMSSICIELLERNGLTADDLDVVVPHQANIRIIEAVGKKIGVPAEKVFVNVQKYGNTSGASVPIAMTEARAAGFIKDGDLVLLTAFGSGFTWGAALVRF